MTTSDLPVNVDYTSRDFAGFRTALLNYASERTPEWRAARTGDPNDFGVLLVELFAYEGDVLSYYTDRVADEAFLATATQRQSVLNHAALLDYTPRAATPARAALTFTVTTTTQPVTVPRGFKVATASTGQTSGDAPLVFETQDPVTFPASTTRDAQGRLVPLRTSLDVLAVEGITVTDEVVGTHCGDPNETFTLQQAPAIVDSVVLRVVERPGDLGQVWFRVRNLLDARRTDNAYMLTLDANDAVTITFGDGVNGRIPPRGAVVRASYRVGGGSDGNVDSGVITDPLEPGDLVVEGNEPPLAPVELIVTNTLPARGGSDSESLESIRVNAPRARQSGGRAVTLSDYEVLAKTTPGVQVAKAKAVARTYTNVTLYVAPPGGLMPDQRMLNTVLDYLTPRKLAGVTVVPASPTYVPIDVTLHVIVDSRYSQSNVMQSVRNTLAQVLAFEKVGFGEPVTMTSIYSALTQLPGVINLVISRLRRNTATTTTPADVALYENELPIVGAVGLTAEGGIVNTAPEGTARTPVASSAPAIALMRCDPTSTHYELTWARGADTTQWVVELEYRDTAGAVVSTTTAGPFTYPEAIFDTPRIGAGRATTVALRTQAFNGNTGPVYSGWTTTTYTCE